jgi:hypothetical protein
MPLTIVQDTAAPDAAKDSTVQSSSAAAPAKQLSRSGYDITPLPRATVAELAKKLSPEAYRITQNAGTEPAFCGTLLDNKKDGTYCCVVCGTMIVTLPVIAPVKPYAMRFNSEPDSW